MKISVCIPTYNQSKYLEQSIRSALNQTLVPDEIIVSNDCSTDDTKSLLTYLQNEIQCLKVINQSKNLGIAANVTACMQEAKGDYIVKLDSDDLLLPGFIKELFCLLEKYASAGYAHAAVEEIDINDNFLKHRKLIRSSEYIDGDAALKASLKGYKVAANIIMYRKSVLQEVGYIISRVNFSEDYYLAAQIAAKGYGNVYSDNVLACYRVWQDGASVRIKRKIEEITGLCAVFDEVIVKEFKSKGWDTKIIDKFRTKTAIVQSDCLGWSVYSNDEKKELRKLIIKLSNTRKTRSFLWLYEKGLGKIASFYLNINKQLKTTVKKIFLFFLKKIR